MLSDVWFSVPLKLADVVNTELSLVANETLFDFSFFPPPITLVDEEDADKIEEDPPSSSCSEPDSGEDCIIEDEVDPVLIEDADVAEEEEEDGNCGEKIGRSDEPLGRDGEKKAAWVMSLILLE